MKVLLAGEGSDDIGDWSRELAYRPGPDTRQGGIVGTLLARVAPPDWVIVDGLPWTKIRKYQAGKHQQRETRNVLGLALFAEEHGYDAVVFTRDRDGDRDRAQDVADGVARARSEFAVGVLGEMAVEEIEAWVLALLGETGSEAHTDAKGRLEAVHAIATGAEKVGVVARARLDSLPQDARSLRSWIDQIRSHVRLSHPSI